MLNPPLDSAAWLYGGVITTDWLAVSFSPFLFVWVGGLEHWKEGLEAGLQPLTLHLGDWRHDN